MDWQAGSTLWLRWLDTDSPGDEHSMAIDDFRFSASVTAVPEPSSLLLIVITMVGGLAWRQVRERKK